MAADQITRVRYFERQFLRAVDFRDEQTYDRDARRRHALAQHTWGIVTGLEIVEVKVQGDGDFVEPVLQPGVAIDAFGRELVCYDPLRLDATLFDAFNSPQSKLEVWIGYHEEESGAAQSGWADCQDTAATRITESWRLVVSPPGPPTDEIIVDGVAAGSGLPEAPALPDDTSVPYQELPQAPPADRWLILLGAVTWDGEEQRFLPTPLASSAVDKRRYAGAVADHLLSPASQLAIRRRQAAPEIDADEFATVEGRLRVQGRINAEKDVWVEGGKVHFTFAPGDEETVPVTLGRQHPGPGETEDELRLQLGNGTPTVALSIGAGDAGEVVRVSTEDTVDIPTGTARFGEKTRQMLALYGKPDAASIGIGVQPDILYFRSSSEFRWYRGGTHKDDLADAGGGDLQLRLDNNADLHFGSRVRQMLNLWGLAYGIGVQAWTLYFRTHGDFCWFRDGAHNDARGNPGGGNLAMRLDSDDHLWLSGALTVGSNALISGDLVTGGDTHLGGPLLVDGNTRIGGNLQVVGRARSVIEVRHYEHVQQNAPAPGGAQPIQWTKDVSGDFHEVFDAFVVLNGFSIWSQAPVTDDKDTPQPVAFREFHHNQQNTECIVQHAYVRVVARTATTITMESFCQQADTVTESVNTTLSTLVVLGRIKP